MEEAPPLPCEFYGIIRASLPFSETKMLKTLKYTFIVIIIILVAFLYWFLPKYSLVQKHPGSCTKLTTHLYYCGNQATLDRLFK
jgi:hypothetical protein